MRTLPQRSLSRPDSPLSALRRCRHCDRHRCPRHVLCGCGSGRWRGRLWRCLQLMHKRSTASCAELARRLAPALSTKVDERGRVDDGSSSGGWGGGISCMSGHISSVCRRVCGLDLPRRRRRRQQQIGVRPDNACLRKHADPKAHAFQLAERGDDFVVDPGLAQDKSMIQRRFINASASPPMISLNTSTLEFSGSVSPGVSMMITSRPLTSLSCLAARHCHSRCRAHGQKLCSPTSKFAKLLFPTPQWPQRTARAAVALQTLRRATLARYTILVRDGRRGGVQHNSAVRAGAERAAWDDAHR